MKRTTKLALGLAAVVVVLGLFLLPVVPITVAFSSGPIMYVAPASVSPMYAYLGLGMVYVPHAFSDGHSFCWMEGSSGTMCGIPMQLTVSVKLR